MIFPRGKERKKGSSLTGEFTTGTFFRYAAGLSSAGLRGLPLKTRDFGSWFEIFYANIYIVKLNAVNGISVFIIASLRYNCNPEHYISTIAIIREKKVYHCVIFTLIQITENIEGGKGGKQVYRGTRPIPMRRPNQDAEKARADV